MSIGLYKICLKISYRRRPKQHVQLHHLPLLLISNLYLLSTTLLSKDQTTLSWWSQYYCWIWVLLDDLYIGHSYSCSCIWFYFFLGPNQKVHYWHLNIHHPHIFPKKKMEYQLFGMTRPTIKITECHLSLVSLTVFVSMRLQMEDYWYL